MSTRGSQGGNSAPALAASVGRAWGWSLFSALRRRGYLTGSAASSASASASSSAPWSITSRVAPSPPRRLGGPSPSWLSSSGSRSLTRGLTLLAHSACLLPLHPHPPPLSLGVPSVAAGSILGVPGALPSLFGSSWGCSRSPVPDWVPPRSSPRAMTRLLTLSILSLARAALSLALAPSTSLRLANAIRFHSPRNSSAS